MNRWPFEYARGSNLMKRENNKKKCHPIFPISGNAPKNYDIYNYSITEEEEEEAKLWLVKIILNNEQIIWVADCDILYEESPVRFSIF